MWLDSPQRIKVDGHEELVYTEAQLEAAKAGDVYGLTCCRAWQQTAFARVMRMASSG